MHNGTDTRRENWETRERERDLGLAAIAHMLLIIGVLLTAITAAFIYRARVPGGVNANQLGWVSARWLAEYRASNPT